MQKDARKLQHKNLEVQFKLRENPSVLSWAREKVKNTKRPWQEKRVKTKNREVDVDGYLGEKRIGGCWDQKEGWTRIYLSGGGLVVGKLGPAVRHSGHYCWDERQSQESACSAGKKSQATRFKMTQRETIFQEKCNCKKKCDHVQEKPNFSCSFSQQAMHWISWYRQIRPLLPQLVLIYTVQQLGGQCLEEV